MRRMRNSAGLIFTLAFVAIFLMAGGVYAKDYPARSINLIIPWFPGGLTDTCARTYAPLLEKYIGTSVVVVNKGGASGSIGSDFVLRQKADGYNVLYSAETPGVFQVMGFSKSSFNDFDPIMMMIQDTKVIVVPKNSPTKPLKTLSPTSASAPARSGNPTQAPAPAATYRDCFSGKSA